MSFRPEGRKSKDLWKYAIKSVRFLLKQQKTGIERPTASPSEYIFWKEDFTSGYIQARSTPFPSLSPMFKSVLLLTPTDVLQLWLSDLVEAEVHAETQAQSEGISAWLKSWWKSEPPQELSEVSFTSLRSPRDSKWLEVRLTVNQAEVELAQTRLQAGNQWEGFRLWTETIQLSVTANSKSLQSQLKIARLGAVIWTDQRTNRDSWDFISSQESPQLAIDLAWGAQDDFEIACILRGTELRYRRELLAHLVALWSQVDLAPRESVSAWETVALMRNAGQDTWKRVAGKARKRFTLRANRLKLIISLTSDEAIQVSIATLAFDIPEDPTLKKSINVSSASVTSQSAAGEEAMLTDISVKVFTKGETVDRNILVECSDFELRCNHLLYHRIKDYCTASSLPPVLSIAREHEKRVILKSAVKSDVLETSSDSVVWDSAFTVISGAYVYFFNSPKDLVASSYFYLTNVHLAAEELGLSLISDTADCHIRFKSPSQLEDWLACLQSHIDSLSKAGLIASKPKKQENKQKVKVTFSSPKAAVVLEDAGMDLAVKLEVLDLTVKVEKGVKLTWGNMVLTEEKTAQALIALPNAEEIELVKGPIALHFSCILIHWHIYTFRSLWSFFQFRPYESEPEAITPRVASPPAGTLAVTVSCALIDLYFANQINGFLLAHLQAKDTTCSIRQSEGQGKKIAVSIPMLRAEDLMDYPRTMLKRPANEPLVLLEGDLDLEFELRPDTNAKLQGNFLSIRSQSLSLVYINQPILRVWNYIQTKLLGIFDKE